MYDLRANRLFTLKTNLLKRGDLDAVVACYKPEERSARAPTWDAGANPDGRWRAYEHAELAKRDKADPDLFWLRDASPEESANLPETDDLVREIADDLQSAAEQFAAVAVKLKG